MADVVPQFIADPTMCSNETEGQTCFWEYGDKGGVLYNEYDSCSKTAILLPGFNLLPNWFLASTPPHFLHVLFWPILWGSNNVTFWSTVAYKIACTSLKQLCIFSVVYGLTLTWSFFGIAIISDTFMSAIEVITSLEREVKRRGNDGSEITLYASLSKPCPCVFDLPHTYINIHAELEIRHIPAGRCSFGTHLLPI